MTTVPAPQRWQGGRRRTASRLAAVQALYQIDISGGSAASVIAEFVHHRLGPGGAEDEGFGEADKALFADIVTGVLARQADIDRLVGGALSAEWPLDRIEIILRAILRAGTYELLAKTDVPVRVAISEYLDIAHAFFDGKEPGMVNGVLDRVARTLRQDGLREDSDDGGPAA